MMARAGQPQMRSKSVKNRSRQLQPLLGTSIDLHTGG